jgi:hypothetical protein
LQAARYSGRNAAAGDAIASVALGSVKAFICGFDQFFKILHRGRFHGNAYADTA